MRAADAALLAVAQIPFQRRRRGRLLRRSRRAAAHPLVPGRRLPPLLPRPRAHRHASVASPGCSESLTPASFARRIRYTLRYLPYLYTLFYLNTLNGMPIMRPLWVEFPADAATQDVEDQFLLGSALLVKPVVAAGSDHRSGLPAWPARRAWPGGVVRPGRAMRGMSAGETCQRAHAAAAHSGVPARWQHHRASASALVAAAV